jgi:hypothetical protein
MGAVCSFQELGNENAIGPLEVQLHGVLVRLDTIGVVVVDQTHLLSAHITHKKPTRHPTVVVPYLLGTPRSTFDPVFVAMVNNDYGYQPSETTSLFHPEIQSRVRPAWTKYLTIAVGASLLVVAALLVVPPHHPMVSQAYVMMGLSRSVPLGLNSEPTSAPIGCESTIMLIRHCDKDGPLTTDDDDKSRHCSYEGFQRAYFLTSLFGNTWPIPSKLYALAGSRKGHKNYREIEILEPLSYKIGVDINSKFSTRHTQDAAQEIFEELRAGKLCGKLTVFAWKHSHMPQLAHALGWKDAPSHYPSKNFDQVWQIKYVYDPPAIYKVHKHKHSRSSSSGGGSGASEVHSKRILKQSSSPEWVVYGHVSYQNFDPLTFGYVSGDYPHGGKNIGASWAFDL